MFRKIERKMLEAMRDKRNWHKDNTEVTYDNAFPHEKLVVRLHGNTIAMLRWFSWGADLRICDGNYRWTRTTQSRLNAILDALGSKRRLCTVKFEPWFYYPNSLTEDEPIGAGWHSALEWRYPEEPKYGYGI